MEAQEETKTPGSGKSRADGPDGNGLFDCVRYADRHGDLRQPGLDRHGGGDRSATTAAHPIILHGGIVRVADILNFTQLHTCSLGQFGGQAARIRHRFLTSLRHRGGFIGHVEGNTVNIIGARLDGCIEQAAQRGQVAHGDVDRVIHRIGRTGLLAGQLVIRFIDTEIAGLYIHRGNARIFQGIHQSLGLGVINTDRCGNGGLLGVHANVNISDIGGQVDRAIAADVQCAGLRGRSAGTEHQC